MGRSGTDVAREAADLVLLDDDFATIVAAVEQGRATFANIRRFLTYHLTDNVAELTPFVVWALSGGRFPLALGVLQILFLDIGTDLLPALALGIEAPNPQLLHQPPEGRHLIDRKLLVPRLRRPGPDGGRHGDVGVRRRARRGGWRPGQAFPTGHALLAASGAAFATVVLAQIANAFACRSATHPPGRLGWWSNRFLVWAVAVELVALGGVPVRATDGPRPGARGAPGPGLGGRPAQRSGAAHRRPSPQVAQGAPTWALSTDVSSPSMLPGNPFRGGSAGGRESTGTDLSRVVASFGSNSTRSPTLGHVVPRRWRLPSCR